MLLERAGDRRAIYGLRRHWRDDTAVASFDSLTLFERLAARAMRADCTAA